MSLPAVTVTTRDGALGIVGANGDNLVAVIGPCSSGTAATPTKIGDTKELTDTFGGGPMVEAAAQLLAAGAGPIICVRSTTTTAAAVPGGGTTTQTGTGPAITLSGTPRDGYSVQVYVVVGGTRGTATYKYSLDGGNTWSVVLVSAATYAIPNSGVTLNFPTGTYVADEVYSGTCTPPRTTSTDFGTALDALLADTTDPSLVGAFCEPVDASAAEAIASSMSSKLETAATAFRYLRGVVGCGSVAVSGLPAAVASDAFPRVALAGGTCTLLSPLTGRIESRSVALPIFARIATSPVHESPARVASGALRNVRDLAVTATQADTLDAGRVMTLRQHIGRPGLYIASSVSLAAGGSDYSRFQNGRVIDKACRLVRPRALEFLEDSLRVKSDGKLLEQEASRIEAHVNGALRDSLVTAGNAQESSVTVSRTQNVQSTSILPITVSVLPFAYPRTISVSIGFTAVAA